MSGEDKGDKKSIDVNEITTRVSDEVDQKVAARIEALSRKLESQSASKKEDEVDDDFSWLDEDEPKKEQGITGKHLEKFADQLLKSVRGELDKHKKDIDQSVYGAFVSKDRSEVSKQNTLNDFPMLNGKSPAYDKEFVQLVKTEIDERVARGRDPNDPDLVYDSAAAVKVRHGKWDKNMKDKVDEETRKFNNNAMNVPFHSKKGNSKAVPSSYQLKLAKESGIPEERLQKLWVKHKFV